MGSKKKDAQNLIRQYIHETGAVQYEMSHVAQWAIAKGLYRPKPYNPAAELARELAQAAREETRRNPETGRTYRVYHAVRFTRDGKQQAFWCDIDVAPRKSIHMALTQRRDQMIGDGVQLIQDADHFNRSRPQEQPIQIELDFTADVQERLAADLPENDGDEDDDAA